jgi:capsid protein
LAAGLSTLERECAEQGEDYLETIQQRARERKEMMALGLDPDAMPGRKPPSEDGDDALPARRAKAFA